MKWLDTNTRIHKDYMVNRYMYSVEKRRSISSLVSSAQDERTKLTPQRSADFSGFVAIALENPQKEIF